MGLTIFLLGLLYVVFIGVLLSLRVSSAVVIVIAVGVLVAQWAFSDKIAMAAMRAREVTRRRHRSCTPRRPAVHPGRHAEAAGHVAETDLPNAFATGRSPSRAVVCATTGIMQRLSPPELEAVLAHELSHVAHRDVTVMTIASFLGVLAGAIVRFAAWGGDRRWRDNRDSGGVPVVVIILLVSAIVLLRRLLFTRALSRYRELSADRGAAQLTGRPSLLSSALVKISGDMARIWPRPAHGRARERPAPGPGPADQGQSRRPVRDPPAAGAPPGPARPHRGGATPSAMGFLDAISAAPHRGRQAGRAVRAPGRGDHPGGAGLRPSGFAAVAFKPAAGQDFAQLDGELRALLEMGARESGSELKVTEDKFGYRWVVLRDPQLRTWSPPCTW